MTQFILIIIAIPVAGVLLFNIRRIIFIVTILLAADKNKRSYSFGQELFPEILILVPCRNEAGMIPDLCQALSRLHYPRKQSG